MHGILDRKFAKEYSAHVSSVCMHALALQGGFGSIHLWYTVARVERRIHASPCKHMRHVSVYAVVCVYVVYVNRICMQIGCSHDR